MENTKTKKGGFWSSPIARTKITSANVSGKEMFLGYLLGPLLAFITNAVFNAYLNRYYNQYFNWGDGESPLHWLSIFLPLIASAFIILGNIVVGRLIDRTKTHQGKARPYMLLAAPLIILSVILIFIVDPSWPIATQMAMLSLSYIMYYGVSYPFYYTSHASMVGLSTRNASKRSLLGTLSNASSIAAVGLIASIVVPMFLSPVLFPDAAKMGISTAEAAAIGLQNWKWFMIALIATTLIGILLEYFFTRERVTEENMKLEIHEEKVSMAKQCKAVVKSPYWWLIIAYFLLWQLGGQVKNASLTFYTQAYADSFGMDEGTAMSLFGIIGGIPTAIGMLVAWPIANKFGKARSMCVGLIISVLGGALSFIDMGNIWWAGAGLFLKGVGSAPAMYVSLALLTDILNHLEAKNKFRSDGFTMAIYGAIMVGMAGVANSLINMIKGSVPDEAWKAATGYIYFGVELICYAILVIVLIFINVEKYNEEDFQTIRRYQKETVLAQGKVWIEPEEKLRLEQEEADRKAEEDRVNELKAKCEKKGLSYEEEEAKYQAKLLKKKEFMAKFSKPKKKLEEDLEEKEIVEEDLPSDDDKAE